MADQVLFQCPNCGASITNSLNCEYCGSLLIRFEAQNIPLNLVKYGNKVSFVGNIEQNVFVLKTFKPEEVEGELLFMEFCTQTPYSATYSVIINRFKALVKVSETEISLIEEYE